MDDIIKVNYEKEQPTVSARELHEKLNIEKRFSAWFETNSQGFIEGEDFTSVLSGTVVNNGAHRELQDYKMSIDMAKHICLMSRTEKGKQCRQYFIELEKAWNTPEQIFARALKMADAKIQDLQSEITVMKPKALFADAVSTSHNSILIRELAKILRQNGFDTGEKRLFEWLRDNGYLIRKRGDDYNTPTQKSSDMGLIEIVKSTITYSDGRTMVSKTPKITGKGQQYFVNKLIMS